ncbi:MAG: O-antigen ligase family protein [Verrucomicrobiota bacterium]|nr:O-antigen ligase family protein [Verrucomicrobiota bacterium]
MIYPLIVFFILLCLSYPLALFVPVQTISMVFHISLPIWTILSALSLFYLIKHFVSLSRSALIVFITLAVFIALSIGLNFTQINTLRSIVDLLGYFLIPFALALFFKIVSTQDSQKYDIDNLIVLFLSIFCFINILHGFWQIDKNFDMVCLAGNRNWCASTLLSLFPWIVFFVYKKQKIIYSRLNLSFLNKYIADLLLLTCPIFVGALLLYFIYRCESRAAWLALIAFVLIYIFIKLEKWLLRTLYFFLIVLSVLFMLITLTDKVSKAIKADIRIPLWWQSSRMIIDNPCGVSPGNFRKEFVKYRSISQKQRLVSAPVTEHPHNEFLNISAQSGIIPGIFWLCFAFYALFLWKKREHPDKENMRNEKVCGLHKSTVYMAAFSFFVIFFHSFFDKVFIEPPSNILAVFFQGILLSRSEFFFKNNPAKKILQQLHKILIPTFFLFLFYLLFISFNELMRSYYFRKAVLSEIKQKYNETFNAYLNAQKYEPQNIKTHFLAGTVAIDRLKKPKLAIPHLIDTFRMDPNYARVNLKLAMAYGRIGDHKKTNLFLKRESLLYPFDAQVLQLLLFNQIILNRCEKALGRDKLLSTLVNERFDRYAKKEHWNKEKILKDFFLSFSSGLNPKLFHKTAQKILKPLQISGCDPMVNRIVKNTSPERQQTLSSKFWSLEDLMFWTNAAMMKKEVQKILSMEKIQDLKGFQKIEGICEIFEKHFPEVVPSKDHEEYMYPLETWEKKKESFHNIAFAFNEFMYQAGYDIIFYTDSSLSEALNKKDSLHFLLSADKLKLRGSIFKEKTTLKVSVEQLSINDFNNYKTAQKLYLFCYFQTGMARNQTIYKLLSKQKNIDFIKQPLPRIAFFPSLQLQKYKKIFLKKDSSTPKIILYITNL